MTATREIAPAKLNLALHVRGKLPDGRHSIETMFAFCTDGDRLSAESADDAISLQVTGPFASDLAGEEDNLVIRAARMLAEASGMGQGASMVLEKWLPVASGLGGGSADAAATLRLLTSMWRIDPSHAEKVAPRLGSDVPACLLSLPAVGKGAGDELTPVELSLAGKPVLLVNPRMPVPTASVYAAWDGHDHGPLSNWRQGRNDLEGPAIALVPQIGSVLAWLGMQGGTEFVRMSGSGASCFALFESKEARDSAADAVPREWWRLATFLR